MKNFFKIMSTLLCIALIVYIGFSLYVSISVNTLINDINDNGSYDTSHFEDESVADQLVIRDGYSTEGAVTEKLELSFPVFLHYFTGGEAYYKYTFEAINSNGEIVAGGEDIPVTLKVKMDGLNWVITDYEEVP